MQKNVSAVVSIVKPRSLFLALLLSGFTLVATGGLLTLCSCAHTGPGLERELVLYQAATNTEGQLKRVIPYVPPSL